MSTQTETPSTYELHENTLDAVRDLWPTIKGIDILLFQNDLFYKIRQLEVKVEGLGSARGFLPASFAQMIGLQNIDNWSSGSESYDKVWADLIESATPETEEALDIFEDEICGWVQDMIPEDYNYFMAALDEGTLNAEWLGRAQMFFEKSQADVVAVPVVEAEPVAEPEPVAVAVAPAPRWRSSNTRRRNAGFGLSTSARRRVRLTRRSMIAQKPNK